jgi:hypothetical protein
MMEGLVVRANAVARAAQSRRLAEIAATLRGRGVNVEVSADSVILQARGLLHKWLTDPLIRFAGRNRP